MGAGLGYKNFLTGDVLTAADTNGYLMQNIWVFANAAARSAAVISPQEGNFSYLKDTNSTQYYDGSSWVDIGGGGGGKVLQVISAASTGSLSTTSASFQDTNLAVTITPSATSSKVLVFVSQQFGMVKTTNYVYGGIQLVRGSTSIKDWGSPLLGFATSSGTNSEVFNIANFHYLDSPATTSATTYKTQMKSYDGATVQANNFTSSIITVMEIGA